MLSFMCVLSQELTVVRHNGSRSHSHSCLGTPTPGYEGLTPTKDVSAV